MPRLSTIEKIENRFNCKVKDPMIRDVCDHLDASSLGAESRVDDYLSKEIEAKWIVQFCEERGLLYEPLPFAVYLDEGAEQKVFFIRDRAKVLKLKDAIFYVNWTQYLEGLASDP